MIQPSADRLALLYRVSQAFNSSLDLDEVLNRVIDETIAAVQAERGFLMLRDAGGQLRFRVARGIDRSSIDQPQFEVSRNVVQRVAAEGVPLLTSDAQIDSRLKAHQSVMLLGLRAILCVPLLIKDQLLGVLYVDNRVQSGVFRSDDLDLLTAISASAATAIENARLYQLAVEKGRLEQELQMARDLQTSLLPRTTPQIPGWEFAAYWQPARQVAGDFYDFIPLRETTPDLGLLIADVSDKGMPAALFMALSRTIIRASVAHAATEAEGIMEANRLICADSTNSTFVTVFYAHLTPRNEVTYVNAGHNPPYLYHAGGVGVQRLTNTGMALGIEERPCTAQTVRMGSGDVMILYTDGMLDALNAHGEEFGDERLRRVCVRHRTDSAEQIVAALRDEVLAFVGTTPLADDCTVVVAKRL